jgi:hypothetical protein
MLWNDVITSPYLRDLPFKIELNKWGKIEMSPASNIHGHQQGEIYKQDKQKQAKRQILCPTSLPPTLQVKEHCQ